MGNSPAGYDFANMAKSRRERERIRELQNIVRDSENITPEYSKLLRQILDREKLDPVDLYRTGKPSKQVVWRVLLHRERPVIKAAAAVRAAILLLRPDLEIPPPSVAVKDEAHYDWMRVGGWLQDERPELFRVVLEQIRTIAKASAETENAIAEISHLAQLGKAKTNEDG